VEEVPRERDAVFAVLEAKQSDGHGCCAGRSWGVRVSTVSLKGNYTKWKQTYENISHRSSRRMRLILACITAENAVLFAK
jgi:hypothetical protein